MRKVSVLQDLWKLLKAIIKTLVTNQKMLILIPILCPWSSLSRAVLDADIIISLPKFKTHGLTVITGAIKNSYGFLPGAQKAKLHMIAGSPERFHELIANIFSLRVPDLFLGQ